MDLQLAGKRALITGASQGIGRAIAEVFAEEGCDLVLVARRQAQLDEVAQAIRSRRQVDVRVIAADLSAEAAIKAVSAAAGTLDVLVNCAGAIPPGALTDVDDATLRKAWDLKVFGYISLCREVFPAMAARRSGVIVNIIGSAGERFPPNYIAGAAGNAALMSFTRALGREAAGVGVRVLAINPGPVATERLERLQRNAASKSLGDPERWREMMASMPYGRAATPQEIGHAAAFLASPLSGYTNGTILTIDGGP